MDRFMVKIHLTFMWIMLLLPTVVHSGSKSELDAMLALTSRKCRKTFENCLQQSQTSGLSYKNGDACRLLFDFTDYGVRFFHCLVSNGLCTEDEFDQLIGAACDDVDTDLAVSQHKYRFYQSIDARSEKCQERILYCMNVSTVATIIKQEEEFCYLFFLDINNVTSKACLTVNGDCSSTDINALSIAACYINDKHDPWPTSIGFSDVIMLTSPKCKESIENCVEQSYSALSGIRNGHYCRAMSLGDNGQTAHTCLVSNVGCTDEEFQVLRTVACREDEAINNASGMCVKSLNHCFSLSKLAQFYAQSGQFCELFDMKFNGVTAYQCLVNLGFCTALEYDLMRAVYCDDDPDLNAALSHILLYELLDMTTDACQANVLKCVTNSVIATLLKTDNQFCELMNLKTNGISAYTCLQNCTVFDLALIQAISCNTSLTYPPSPFTKSVLSTSQKCKDTIEQCAFGSSLAFSSIQSGEYCQLMNVYQNGAETYACLVGSGGCTDSEYGVMTDAACDSG